MVQAVEARPETQDMVMVHRVFRREFRLAPQMVRAVLPGDVSRAGTVAAHLAEMTTMLHHHHTGEDELVWPKLHARVEVAQALVARMEEQHVAVGRLLAEADELLPLWKASADVEQRERLASVLEELSGALDAHLDEEEREVLPLCRDHLTAAEWAEIGQRGMAAIAKPRLLVVLGHILEEASPEERAAFMSHVPAPARLAFRVVGRRSYEREVAGLRRGLTVPQQRRP